MSTMLWDFCGFTVVVPTGFDHDASAFEVAFEGLALAA